MHFLHHTELTAVVETGQGRTQCEVARALSSAGAPQVLSTAIKAKVLSPTGPKVTYVHLVSTRCATSTPSAPIKFSLICIPPPTTSAEDVAMCWEDPKHHLEE